MVFQDPYSSLNPRLTAEQIVTEPIENYQALAATIGANERRHCSTRVGLRSDEMVKYPFEFSGGQRQRLGIARALALAARR